jgi:hypothetical protein
MAEYSIHSNNGIDRSTRSAALWRVSFPSIATAISRDVDGSVQA